jgi:GT2 family glycosyltransferase
MTDPELSVIIVTLKEQKEELECFEPLENGTFDDFEVIIRRDAGISRARNEGIRAASADKLVFIDDDAIPCREYLAEAARVLNDYAMVAGRVVHNGPELISEFAEGYDQGKTPKLTDTLVGCNMGFRREVFETVGYFDEAIQWGHDETELADRAIESYDIYYNPDMVVEHPYAESIPDYLRKMWKFGPADVYYGKKSEVSERGVIHTLFAPSQYLASTLTGTIVKSAGRILRNIRIGWVLLTQQYSGDSMSGSE